jgi:uridylate kinase
MENTVLTNKKRILLKLTGKILGSCTQEPINKSAPSTLGTSTLGTSSLGTCHFKDLIEQIKLIKQKHSISIVIGGGNIIRGDAQSLASGTTPAIAHQAGMLATVINGLILKDILEKNNIEAELLSSIVCPQICKAVSQENIDNACKEDKVIIFTGGTGAPFFTTDTNMIIRALQVGAKEVWKCTNIDGVYSSDPKKDKNAKILKNIKYSQAISQNLEIMDITALILAEKHKIIVRVFNIFEDNSLIKASNNINFGSLIS